MASAVRTGRVLFSTMILARSEWATISWAVFSQYCRSEAMPAPWPKVLVGVLTETKMMSASRMPAAMSVEKNRLRPRACADHVEQAGLEDRQVVRIPAPDALFVDVDHRHLVVGALGGDDRHGRAAHVAGADAQDVLLEFHCRSFMSAADAPLSLAIIFRVPLDEALHPGLDRRGGGEAHVAAQVLDVGAGFGHVARLQGQQGLLRLPGPGSFR